MNKTSVSSTATTRCVNVFLAAYTQNIQKHCAENCGQNPSFTL